MPWRALHAARPSVDRVYLASERAPQTSSARPLLQMGLMNRASARSGWSGFGVHAIGPIDETNENTRRPTYRPLSPYGACSKKMRHTANHRTLTRPAQISFVNSLAGASPSGKASVFGADIRRFESCRPKARADAPRAEGSAGLSVRPGECDGPDGVDTGGLAGGRQRTQNLHRQQQSSPRARSGQDPEGAPRRGQGRSASPTGKSTSSSARTCAPATSS